MAQVACCPQCKHDLLVPDATDRDSWAKCPECRAFFQVQQAALRELPALLLVESHLPDVESDSSAGEVPSLEMAAKPADQGPAAIAAAEGDAEPVFEGPPRAADGTQSTAERIDEWFRSAKTVPDVPPNFAREALSDAAGDAATFGEVKLEGPSESAPSEAAWDDSHHMERLLADIETRPDNAADDDEAPTVPEDRGDYAETIAETSAADIPVFAKAARGKPRRKRSLLRTVMVSAAAGVVGSALGYYALLWLRGPTGDFLDVAQYLPNAILPAELQAEPRQLAAAAPPSMLNRIEEAELAAASPAKNEEDSAEIQATYTTTDEPAPAKSQAVDDRYGIQTNSAEPAEEPAPLEEPTAAPLAANAAPTDEARITNAPSFTSDELAIALEAAREAQPSLTTGDLDDGREVQRAKGYSYSLLADLAQKAIFVDASSNPESVAASLQAAEELFRLTLSDPHTRGEVAVILPKWIASPHRKQGGVFFAALLANAQQAGTVVECKAAIETGQSLTLLFPPTLAGGLEESSRPLGIVGWIVDAPLDQVNGYTGKARQAVWVGKLIPLE